MQIYSTGLRFSGLNTASFHSVIQSYGTTCSLEVCDTHADTTLLTTVSQALLLLCKLQKGAGEISQEREVQLTLEQHGN